MTGQITEKSFAYALKENLRVITALVIRSGVTRFGESKLGYLWVLAEPSAYIIMYLLIHTVAKASTHIPFGDSALLFMMAGIFGFRMARGISQKAAGAIAANQPMLTYPLIRPLDTVIAAFLLEMVIWLIICAAFLIFLSITLDRKIIVYPQEFANCLMAILYFAFSFAVFNATIGTLIPVWATAVKIASLPLMITSGIFFMPSSMPPSVMKIIAWNPFLHCVEWFRSATYLDYITVLDKSYLMGVSTVLLLTGLMVERMYRSKIVNA